MSSKLDVSSSPDNSGTTGATARRKRIINLFFNKITIFNVSMHVSKDTNRIKNKALKGYQITINKGIIIYYKQGIKNHKKVEKIIKQGS